MFQITHHNGHAIIGRSTSRDIGYVNLPAIECPPLSMAPITHDVQTLQQHVEQPRMRKTIDNIMHKGTNNSVADVLSRVSPLPQRPTGCYSTACAIRQYCSRSVMSRFSPNRSKEGWYSTATTELSSNPINQMQPATRRPLAV